MQDSPSPTTQTPHAPVQYTKISASFGELRGPEVGRPSKAHSGLIGSHAAFNPRYMEHGHGSNPKQKRKGSSSPTKEPISKKKPGKTTEKKLNEIQSAYQHRQRQPTWRHCQGYQVRLTPAPGTLTKVVALVKQPETEPIEQVEESFTLVQRLARKSNTPITQPARKARKRPAAVLVKINEGRTYADTLPTGTNIDFEAMGTHVTSIRKTLKGELLVELTKGAKATAATSEYIRLNRDQAPSHGGSRNNRLSRGDHQG
ncbi:hypothetical protein QTP88_027039 [Uroleucon formosanum]